MSGLRKGYGSQQHQFVGESEGTYVQLESDELPKQAHNHEKNVAICAATA
jgi:hypothetical protein